MSHENPLHSDSGLPGDESSRRARSSSSSGSPSSSPTPSSSSPKAEQQGAATESVADPTAIGQQVMSIIADVENRLDRLRRLSEESGGTLQTLRHQQEALEAKQNEANARLEALARREQEVGERAAGIQERESRVEAQAEALAARETRLESESRRIAQDRVRLEGEARAASEAREALERDQKALESERRAMTERARGVEESRQDMARREAEVQQRFGTFEQRLAVQQERIESLVKEAETAKSKAAAVLEAARADAQAARDLVDEAQSKIDAATREAKENYAKFEQASLRADSTAADLEATNRKLAQAQTLAEGRKTETAALTDNLKAAHGKLSQFAAALEKQSVQIEAGAAALAEKEEHQKEISRLTAELEAREATIRSMRKSVSMVVEPVAVPDATNPDELAKRDEAIAALSAHIRTLQGELKAANDLLAEAATGRSGGEPIGTESSGGESAETNTFNKIRRERLRRARQLLRERRSHLAKTKSTMSVRTDQWKELETSRQTILEARQSLIAAERKMIRRWATGRAVSALFWLTLTTMLLAAGSFVGVLQFWPVTYTAHATVSAKARPGFPMTADQIQAWQNVHEPMVRTDGLTKAVAERLRQRGYEQWSTPTTLGRYLEKNLSFDSPEPGTINLYLLGGIAEDTKRLLETFSIAMVSQSNSERGLRTDGATTDLTVPSTLDASPVVNERQRLQCAGIVFGSTMVVAIIVSVFIIRRLTKSDSVFAEADELFAPISDEAKWAGAKVAVPNSHQHIIR